MTIAHGLSSSRACWRCSALTVLALSRATAERGVVGDAVDLPRQAPGALEQGLDGGRLEQGSSHPGEAEAVLEIGVDLIPIEAGEMVSDDEALAEGLVHGHRQSPPELGEADEDEAHALLRIHGEVGEQAEVLEDVVAQVVGLVDDEDGQLLGLLCEAGDLGPDRVVCRGSGALDGLCRSPMRSICTCRARCLW